jgi:hypothetical protein
MEARAMATTALILDKIPSERTAEARIITAPVVAPAVPASLSVWPPATFNIVNYRTEADRLRSRAIAEALTRAGQWLRR